MCNLYWLRLPRNSVSRLTDQLQMTKTILTGLLKPKQTNKHIQNEVLTNYSNWGNTILFAQTIDLANRFRPAVDYIRQSINIFQKLVVWSPWM